MDRDSIFGLVDELEKIADYKAAILAHELGHAQSRERSKHPKLRMAVDVGAPIIGGGVGLGAALMNKPVVAALSGGVAFAPLLIEEAGATMRAMKNLRDSGKYSEEELKSMRKTLMKAFGTYASGAAGTIGSLAALGVTHKTQYEPLSLVPAALGNLGTLLSSSSLKGDITSSPAIRSSDAEKLRKAMNIKAGIYPSEALASKSHEDEAQISSAMYIPPVSMRSLRDTVRSHLGQHIRSDKKIDQILNEGGVLVRDIKNKR